MGKLEFAIPYENLVECYFSRKSKRNIYGSSPKHSKIIFENLFKNVKNELLIFCDGNDVNLFFKDKQVRDSIPNNIEKKIIVANLDNDSSFKEIFGQEVYPFKKFKDWRIDIFNEIPDKAFGYIKYFAVADGNMYRVERLRELGGEIIHSFASPNDINTGKILRDIFNDLL